MMKIIVAALLSLATTPLFANEGNSAYNYIGVGFGPTKISNAGSGTSFSLIGGYGLSHNFALEFVSLRRESSAITPFANADLAATSLAAFGVYRKPIADGTTYIKSKLGFSQNKADATAYILSSTGGIRQISKTNGLAYGLGLGLNAGSFALELDYTGLGSQASNINFNCLLKF